MIERSRPDFLEIRSCAVPSRHRYGNQTTSDQRQSSVELREPLRI